MPDPRPLPPDLGFTLIEMAVVLVVIGLLILTIFPALIAVRGSSARAATQSNLQALMLATAAYVQANGCVPCPAPATAYGAGFGRAGGSTGTAPCLACAAAEGIPPYVSMGVAPAIAHDGWGRWITMRVDTALTGTTTVPPTGTAGICQANLSSGKSATAVRIYTPGGGTSYQSAAVIFVSYGANGYGAFNASALFQNGINGCRLDFPSAGASCSQNLISSCNASGNGFALAACNADGNNQFVNAAMQAGYDDMMAYANRNVLVSLFGNGTACQTGP